ncbi:unannotated protein [freshwater metagenome]|uniref:Unannotated protein n=1 Tax=freshwater metagenome TaxID=449393 RepID=A0A6J7JKD2_9ZZZZ
MRPPSTTAALRRALTVLLLAALVAPAAAQADYRELLRDACNDGSVSGTYSQADYRKALANIPADALQYTDCKDVLRAAQLAAARSQAHKSSRSGGGDAGPIAHIANPRSSAPAAAPTPEAQAALDDAARGTTKVGGLTLEPSTIGAARSAGSTASDIPTPLLLALALVALGALAGLLLYLLPRVRERRSS